MGLLSVFNVKDYDPEDDRLAEPIEQEAEDLALHVKRCAGRYRQIRKAQHQNAQKIVFNTVLTLVTLAVLILSNGEKALNVLAKLL